MRWEVIILLTSIIFLIEFRLEDTGVIVLLTYIIFEVFVRIQVMDHFHRIYISYKNIFFTIDSVYYVKLQMFPIKFHQNQKQIIRKIFWLS